MNKPSVPSGHMLAALAYFASEDRDGDSHVGINTRGVTLKALERRGWIVVGRRQTSKHSWVSTFSITKEGRRVLLEYARTPESRAHWAREATMP